MEVKQSVRIQTSLLNGVEKKVLVWLAARMPLWVTSDRLTAVGVFGAFLCGLGFALTGRDILWLWLSCLGLVINWFGDSLDGTLARVRHTQRPLYGYYLDHNMDTVCEGFMFVGAGLSPLMHMSLSLMIYAAYLALTVYVSINAHLKNEFRLTYGKLGPTEFRLVIFCANLLLMYVPALTAFSCTLTVLGRTLDLKALDIVAMVLIIILTAIFLISLYKDARYFAKIDPLPNDNRK